MVKLISSIKPFYYEKAIFKRIFGDAEIAISYFSYQPF